MKNNNNNTTKEEDADKERQIILDTVDTYALETGHSMLYVLSILYFGQKFMKMLVMQLLKLGCPTYTAYVKLRVKRND